METPIKNTETNSNVYVTPKKLKKDRRCPDAPKRPNPINRNFNSYIQPVQPFQPTQPLMPIPTTFVFSSTSEQEKQLQQYQKNQFMEPYTSKSGEQPQFNTPSSFFSPPPIKRSILYTAELVLIKETLNDYIARHMKEGDLNAVHDLGKLMLETAYNIM